MAKATESLQRNAPSKAVQQSQSASLLERFKSLDARAVFRLSIGPILLLLGAWIFAGIAKDITTQQPIVRFDLAVVDAIHANTDQTLIHLMTFISIVGSQIPALITLGLVVYFIVNRRKYDLLLLAVTVGGAQIVNELFKAFFQRARPLFSDPITSAVGFSFPSGHSMGSMVFYGLMAYFLVRHSDSVIRYITVIIVFAVIVSLVGFSRIYLGVHYPSDVLGGYSAGLAWLAMMISDVEFIRYWRVRRERRARRKASANLGEHTDSVPQ